MVVEFDFQVVDALREDSVTGRNCGPDIPVGTVFTLLCRRDFGPIIPGEDLPSPDLVLVSPIALRLEAVWWYGRTINHVPTGHTAKLTFSGQGFEDLRHEVSRASRATYFSLCTPA